MLLEKITADELVMIDSYRKYFAKNDGRYAHDSDYADNEYVLRFWKENKGEYLFQLLGGELILKKKFSYTKSEDEMRADIEKIFDKYSGLGRERRNCVSFYNSFLHDFLYNSDYNWSAEMTNNFNTLFTDECLISNRYDGEPFEFPLPNGKKYKVNKGCKISRVLGKIAEAFNLKDYEDFRICHSLVLNQKNLEGELTLSIHPLDFMTMSDNQSGWDSCMSWQEEGSYRMGTVEMMNSPCVVVAYLSADDPMEMPPYHDKYYWNSKKWRQLFIVDPNMIISVKDYPYFNSDLTQTVVEWLRELAQTNLGFEYYEAKKHYYSSDKLDINGEQVCFTTNTGSMYNDFGSPSYHWMCLSKNFDDSQIRRFSHGLPHYYLNYSGKRECMVCGSDSDSFKDESALACGKCDPYYTCEYCGEGLGEGEGYWVDDQLICPYCYEEHTFTCDQCEEVHFDNDWNKTIIYIVPRLTAEMAEQTRNNCVYTANGADGYMISPTYLSCYVLCDSDYCLKQWERDNLKSDCSVHKREMNGVINYYVYTDELEESGYLTRYSRDIDLWNDTYPFSFVE